MTDAPTTDIADFNSEMAKRKAAALQNLGRKAPARPIGYEGLARELAEAPIAAMPSGAALDGPSGGDDWRAEFDGDHGSDHGGDHGAVDPQGGDRSGGGKPDRARGDIWAGCPVVPLGVNGDFSYFLDRLGQLRIIKKLEMQTIMHLFGDRLDLLYSQFPQYNVAKDGSKTKRKDRFDQTSASAAMITACAERGLFNPDGSVRGVGAWCDDDGNLIYHCGAHLLTVDGRKDPGVIDGKIYPAYPAIPEPALTAGSNPALEVLTVAESWRWEHQDVMPMIALGMICVQMLGGALEWRPVYWLTGDKAYGKSAFQDLVKYLHGGDRGLIQSNDPTKSGITSRLGHSSLPVALDELEPGEEGSSKEADIIKLARVAASGGQWLRGSADQKGASGNVYSAFLFSSILIPGAMGPQDRSRLITMNMRPLDTSAPKLSLDPRTWRARGAAMKRLLIDRWPTWAARLSLWRVALAEAGLSGRNGDNWATTLAMADMALNEALPSQEVLDGWARKAMAAAAQETEEIGSDAESMLMHLMGQSFDVHRRGELFTVAQWVMVAAALPSAPHGLVAQTESPTGSIDDQVREQAAKQANEKLAKVGLRVKGKGKDAQLFIPYAPLPGMKKLFERSTWAGGVWSQSAKRIIGAEPVKSPLTLAGQRTRGVYVPLANIGGMLSFPMDRSTPQPSRPVAAPMPDEWEGF